MGRSPCCSKHTDLNRGAWTAKEDMILKEYVTIHGETGWRSLPKNAGLKRCGKSCRLRWLNYLRPDIKRGNISSDEDELIIRLHGLLGNRWSLIAGRLPGRTDNEIKNYWNTHLSKKQQRTVKPSASPDNDEFMKITPVKATAVRIANVCRNLMGSGYSTHKTTESVKTMKSPRTWSEFLGGDFMTDYNSELINSTMAAELGHPFPEISGQYSPEDFPIDEFDELKGSPGHLIEISSIYNGFGQDDAHWIHEFQDFQMSSMSEEDDFSVGMHQMSSVLIHEKV